MLDPSGLGKMLWELLLGRSNDATLLVDYYCA
jgi:hypothetical protein